MEQKMFELWDTMTELGIATDEEIGLATALMGRNIGTLESVLYIRTGCRNLSQFFEDDDDILVEYGE